MAVIILEDKGGGVVWRKVVDLINQWSEEGSVLESVQKGALGVDAIRQIPFDDNSPTRRVAEKCKT